MSTAMKSDIWNAWDRSVGVVTCEPSAQEISSESAEAPPVNEVAKKRSRFEDCGDLRHSRRRTIRSSAEIVDWHSVQVKPDITAVVDASLDGILFQSDHKYRMGMELLVRFPYPCSSSPKQRGRVVRIDEQPDGSSRVAVKFG